MAQVQLSYGVGSFDRRRRPRVNVEHISSLYMAFGAFEGIVAALVLLTPALIYHLFVLHVPVRDMPTGLYLAFACIVGIVHGALSGSAAARLLANGRLQQSVIAESALAWTGAVAVGLLASFLLGRTEELSRVSLVAAYLAGIPTVIAARGLAHMLISARIRAGRLQYRKAAVIGNRSDVVRFLFNGSLWRVGYRLAGTLYLEEARRADGTLDRAVVVELARRWIADGAGYIVIVNELGDVEGLDRLANELKRFSVSVACAPATDNTSLKFLDVVPLGANNAIRFLREPMSDLAVVLKRLFDLAGALCGLLILSPLLLAVALLVRLDSPGPVFYRQERRGFNGRTFFIWKFRSMTVTESGHQMTQVRVGDRRITRVGRFIRRTSIDELPQLLNVLTGEMSLVGPRPHAVVHDDELGQQLASYAHRQRIKPGITGWAQINGYRGETTSLEQVEGRTGHDLYYIDNWSLLLDCWIILLTVFSSKTRINAV